MTLAIDKPVCPLCNSDSTRRYDQVDEWKLIKCSACNFVFTWPIPSPEQLKKFYEAEYFMDERHRSRYANDDGSTVTENESEYLNRFYDVEAFCTKRGSVLDVGAARGGMLNVFRKYGWEANGIEISEDAVKKAKELYGLDIYCGTFVDFPSDKKFDAITFYEVLEHLPDPAGIVKKAFDLLNPGGILLVEVPNIESIENKFSKRLKLLRYDIPRHLNHFSASTLSKLFTDKGFQVVYSENYRSIYQVKLFHFLQKLKGKKTTAVLNTADKNSNEAGVPEARIKNHKLYLTQKEHSLQTRLANKFPGWRITVIGKKPLI